MLSFRRKAEVFAICCTRCKFGSQSASHLERIKEKEGEWYTTNHQNEQIIQSTERWVRDFVVRRNLCPFASKYRRSIHVINLKNDASNEDCKAHVKDHILHLIADDQLQVSTKLLVFPQERLSEWKEFEKLADSVQHFCGTDGIPGIEIVPFHPKARRGFSPTQLFPEEKALHFTVRSPYPTFHLFKTVDVEKEAVNWAKSHFPSVISPPTGRKVIIGIIENNEPKLNEVGYDTLKRQLQSFYEPVPEVKKGLGGTISVLNKVTTNNPIGTAALADFSCPESPLANFTVHIPFVDTT